MHAGRLPHLAPRQALGALTYTDEHIPQRTDPVSAAQRSPSAKKKDTSKQTSDGLPARSFRDLLSHLATLNRETINFSGQHIEKITNPTPTQRRVFELLDALIPSHSRQEATKTRASNKKAQVSASHVAQDQVSSV